MQDLKTTNFIFGSGELTKHYAKYSSNKIRNLFLEQFKKELLYKENILEGDFVAMFEPHNDLIIVGRAKNIVGLAFRIGNFFAYRLRTIKLTDLEYKIVKSMDGVEIAE